MGMSVWHRRLQVKRTPALALCLLSLALLPSAALAHGRLSATAGRVEYLHLAEEGMRQRSSWGSGGWYCEYLHCTGAYPLLTIWGEVRMFEAANAAELASPSSVRRALVDRFARASESYWNPHLNGYAPYPNDKYRGAEAWFDDNGWLGVAFTEAYRATRESRYLHDARRALTFVAGQGWDAAGGGGMWWNTTHPYHSGEALAADALLATLLYGLDHERSQLATARKLIAWADAHDTGYQGLYLSGGSHSTVIDYIEGPLIYAQYLLCGASGQSGYCEHAAEQAHTMTQIYGVQYNFAPLYDSIFLQWMMAYGKAVGDGHWLALARANAVQASQHAANG
ncbi:MAG TPA: glycoside hydrolase family 76 protein, partial [Solirubrobacteraceae bacterium]|nr:glycoside hydrolase family 76 protein [Solirubrobacteraceae bacterium]